MRWPFNQESKERHREEEEQTRKQQEATRMVADLFIRHNSMSNDAIIEELELLPDREGPLSQLAVTRAETGRLVAMLSWPELRATKDRSAPSCFVLAAIQNPSEVHIPTLSEHVAWLEKEVKPSDPPSIRPTSPRKSD